MKKKRLITIGVLLSLILVTVPLYTVADKFIADIDSEEEAHTHGGGVTAQAVSLYAA